MNSIPIYSSYPHCSVTAHVTAIAPYPTCCIARAAPKSQKCQPALPSSLHIPSTLLHPISASTAQTHLWQIHIWNHDLIQRGWRIPLPPAGVSAGMVLVLALAAIFPRLGAGNGSDLVLAGGGGGIAAEVPAYEGSGADHDCHESLDGGLCQRNARAGGAGMGVGVRVEVQCCWDRDGERLRI